MRIKGKVNPKRLQFLCLVLFMDSVCKQYKDEVTKGTTNKDEFLERISNFLARKFIVIEHTILDSILDQVYVITKKTVQLHKDRRDKLGKEGQLVHHSDVIKMTLSLIDLNLLNKEFKHFKGDILFSEDIPTEVFVEMLQIYTDITYMCNSKLVTYPLSSKPKVSKPKATKFKSKKKSKSPKSQKNTKLSVIKRIIKQKDCNFKSRNGDTLLVVEYKGYEGEISLPTVLSKALDEFKELVEKEINFFYSKNEVLEILKPLNVDLVEFSEDLLEIEYLNYVSKVINNSQLQESLKIFKSEVENLIEKEN